VRAAAIPLLFPPMKIGESTSATAPWRQIHPLSAGDHLGADRLLVIGVRARLAAGVTVDACTPSCRRRGRFSANMLDTLFTDQIYGDLEQLEPHQHAGAQRAAGRPRRRPIETLMLAPKCRSARDRGAPVGEMPQGTAGTAAGDRRPRRIRLPAASYLMFEAATAAR